jgi:hypothetical protein
MYQELTGTDPGRYQPEYAAALANLATDLGATAHPAQALPHAEQAVAIYREAARPNPGRFNLHLAVTLEISEPVLWDAPPVEPPLSSAGPAWGSCCGHR